MEVFKVVIEKPNDFRFAVKALIKLGYADRTFQYKNGTYWLITDNNQGYWSFTDMYPDRMWESTPTKAIDELWQIINSQSQIITPENCMDLEKFNKSQQRYKARKNGSQFSTFKLKTIDEPISTAEQ